MTYLKIDGEFIQGLAGTHWLMIQAIVRSAQGLAKKMIPEFLEDEPALQLLREYGVYYAQGYHVGRPADVQELRRSDAP